MESLIVKNSISKNLLKKSCSFSIINNLNKNAFRQYTIQNKSNLVTSNQISLLNSSIPCVPSISLNNSLISYFNESTSLQNSYKYYSTESSKPTEEKEKKEKEEKDKKVVEEEEEEEEEEDDEIKNITDMKIKISDSAVEVNITIFIYIYIYICVFFFFFFFIIIIINLIHVKIFKFSK